MNIKKIGGLLIILYIIVGIGFYYIGGEQFYFAKSNDSISCNVPETTVGEITHGTKIEQDFYVKSDIISGIGIKMATYGRKNVGNIFVNIVNKENDEVLFSETINALDLEDNSDKFLNISEQVKGVKDKLLAIIITSDIDNPNNAVTVYSGKGNDEFPLYINDELNENSLSFSVECTKELWFGNHYWYIFSFILLILIGYLVNLNNKQKNDKPSLGLNVLSAFTKYKFLLNQLIERDFKTKYKRSVLGVLWSFLNPLLTMTVQYIVFSTIFKSDIPNFPVYLLSGIVIFNFFTEACGIGLMSIIGNASLITKVYMPKYIYPVSKVFSSVINLLLSLIPLIIVIILTKVHITWSMLLLAFPIICTIIFCIGMSFALSTAMVFFRDTQFLWNVISLLWMYATPIFYPETIIPQKFIFILKLNPIYHFVRFVRICILNGVSPEPIAYAYCLVFSLGMLFIGAIVFKRNQDKFVLNI